jgi:uroporphyrin-III C-methyltransferase/precorrin-2 dehydrogenase/sirohydrochlorin ferrochelatase
LVTLSTDFRRDGPGQGIVHIVGAGPGDPDLLTLRALKVLRQADVVIHDRLIGPEILDFARPGAERIYVGKAKSDHSRPQAEINALMAHHAAQGRRVVRLKGGDPFVFGRGGEEMAYLLSREIRVEVVPGITAATGCAAFAGIPLTHRDHATAVTFISGHAKDGDPDLDWVGLATGRQTIVVYMGVSTAGNIARRLIGNGMAPSTPVAVVENGTLPSQKTVTGTLLKLEYLIEQHGIAGPALIIIGDVVRAAAANAATARPLAAAE